MECIHDVTLFLNTSYMTFIGINAMKQDKMKIYPSRYVLSEKLFQDKCGHLKWFRCRKNKTNNQIIMFFIQTEVDR